MIKSVTLGEEIVVATKNKVGLLADMSLIAVNHAINIEAVLGYEAGNTAKILMITSANLKIITELKKKKYRFIRETEVILVDLENRPGALKLVTMELKTHHIDIKYIYVTAPSSGSSSKMVLQTSDNEKAMSLLVSYITPT